MRAVLCVLWLLLPLGAFAGPLHEGGVYRRRIPASDGVGLTLYRYVPPGGGAHKPPVLLVADVGMTRAAFDLHGRGLAPWLSLRGREVFVVEPRGHGRSDKAPGWRLEDLVTRDLPAALDAIARTRGVTPSHLRVDLVAHGYLGTLALAATTRELRGKIGRVVALSTPVEVTVPNPTAKALLEGGGRFSSLALHPDGAEQFELLFARHAKLPRKTLARLRAVGFGDLSREAAGDLLAWMTQGDLPLPEASVRARLRAYDRPTLQLVALRNNWAHPEAATPLREWAPSAKVKVRLLSLMDYLSEDYTHLSLLHGRAAPDEVFEAILRFLDAPADADADAVANAEGP